MLTCNWMQTTVRRKYLFYLQTTEFTGYYKAPPAHTLTYHLFFPVFLTKAIYMSVVCRTQGRRLLPFISFLWPRKRYPEDVIAHKQAIPFRRYCGGVDRTAQRIASQMGRVAGLWNQPGSFIFHTFRWTKPRSSGAIHTVLMDASIVSSKWAFPPIYFLFAPCNSSLMLFVWQLTCLRPATLSLFCQRRKSLWRKRCVSSVLMNTFLLCLSLGYCLSTLVWPNFPKQPLL
jgi:hypothetical protein